MSINNIRYKKLFKKYLDNTLSKEEFSEFWKLTQKDEDNSTLEYLLSELWDKNKSEPYNYRGATKDRIFKQIIKKEKQLSNKAERPLRKNNLIYKVAAVFIVLIAVASVVLLNIAPKNNIVGSGYKTSLKYDIAPGGNKATLTLADGKIIVLDNIDSGMVSLEGKTAIVKKEGKLIYKPIVINQNRISNLLTKKPSLPVSYNTINTPKGGQQMIVLPDGSKVWLNSASSMKFPTLFNDSVRKVEINGEGYFEIQPNKEVPFIVSSKKLNIRVLGTHFNINAYEDEAEEKVALLEGSVQLSTPSTELNQIIEPGQQASLDGSGKLSISEVDVENIIAWKQGKFMFESMDIESIMRQISRWYDIDVEFEKNIQQRFNGTISKDVSLITLLKALGETEEVNFKIEGRKITVF